MKLRFTNDLFDEHIVGINVSLWHSGANMIFQFQM